MNTPRYAWLSVFLVAACGGSATKSDAFSVAWQNDRGRSITALEERLRAVPRSLDVPVVVGVEDGGLVGAKLPSGRVWRHPGPVDSAPVAAANVVVVAGGGELRALDAESGRLFWRIDAKKRALVGAGDDGSTTVVTLAAGRGDPPLVLAVDREGSVLFELEPEGVKDIGRPAALGGVAFVPWGGQYVSALDMKSGDEVARLLLRDLVTHALDVGGTLYFGERALVRFDSQIGLAVTNQATRLLFQPRELPGKPVWLGNGTKPQILDRSARARIRLLARPSAGDGSLGLASDAYAASYFRVIYGLAEGDGRLIFTDALAGDVLGGAAAASGFVFCDSLGKVTLYDAKGRTSGSLELGSRLIGCSVGADTLSVAAGAPRGSLAAQVERTLHELEPNMAAAEGFLIAEIGELKDPEVTRVLIALAENVRLPPAERARARALIAKRRNGVEHMLAALERHYDFIAGEQPPPLGPLADALAALGERRAAPLLARHLNDPANSIADVAHAALALETLATPVELDELRTFFALYRATADDELLVEAVVSVGAAVLRVGGTEGRALVERAANDPLTQPGVQAGLTKLLAPPKVAAPADPPQAPANAPADPDGKTRTP